VASETKPRSARAAPQASRKTSPPRAARAQAQAHAELEAYREQFPILARKTYLNSCSLGALSRRSMEAMNTFQELWNEHGAQAWYTLWMGELAALRAKFARLIGAQPHEIALAPNVSVALGEIASALDLAGREKVLVADMDFPTLAYQWLARQRQGLQVEFVPSPDGSTLPAERFIERIDDQTGLVATSRVFYLSGYLQDVGAIAEAAHRHGAYVVVDDYQGTGQIPIDVKALGIDFLVTGTLKWLMGGPGVAMIYAREDLIPRLAPAMTGWWASSEQFEFRTTQLAFRDDAQRLEAGTPAVAPIYCASAALDLVHEVGVERIREQTRALSDDLVRRIQEKGWTLLGPVESERRSSIVVVKMERPQEVVHALTARGIIVDSRPDRVRISPHFYNTLAENEQVVSAMDEILRKRA
jgi:kynureninase